MVNGSWALPTARRKRSRSAATASFASECGEIARQRTWNGQRRGVIRSRPTGVPVGGGGIETLSLAAPAQALAVADFNHDGQMDVALATSNGITVRLGQERRPGPAFGPELVVWGGQPAPALAAVDFDGDGHPDLVASLGGAVGWLQGDGAGHLTPREPLAQARADRFLVADWNGDAIPDLAFATDTEAMIWTGKGDGRFEAASRLPLPGPVSALAALDIDGDQQPDLAVALRHEPKVLLLSLALHAAVGEIRLREPATALGAHDDHLLTRTGSGPVELWRHRQQGAAYDNGLPAPGLWLDDPKTWRGDLNGDGADDSVSLAPAGLKAATGSFAISGVTKTHADPWNVGDTGKTFTIAASGSHTVGEVALVRDTLPARLTFVTTSLNGWECGQDDVNPQIIDCAWGGGASPYPPIVITVDVSSTASNVLTNQVQVFNNGVAGASTMDTVTPSGGGGGGGGGGTPTPDLTVSKFHLSDFSRGQTGAAYTLTVRNVGTAATAGNIVVTEPPPGGLTVTGMSGIGWICTTETCTTNQSAGIGVALPDITVTVNVSATAPSMVTNVATVVGGGETNTANNSANDLTAVLAPDLTIAKTHTGNFQQGQTNVTDAITVQNLGPVASSGQVTVTENVPPGLTLVSLAGAGWTCSANACTRSDALPALQVYPAITATFNVATTAPSSITNSATVSGGGNANTANDTATVNPASDLTIAKMRTAGGNLLRGQTGVQYTLRVSNAKGASAWSGVITVVDTPGPGLTLTSLSGAGWVFTLATGSCTTSQAVLASGAATTITAVANVTADAGATVVNNVTVSGGGDSVTTNNSASDTANVDGADLAIAKSHTGNFTRGQTGATNTLSITNVGTGATQGAVTVVEQPPAGLTVTALAGPGWSCVLSSLTCTTPNAIQPNGGAFTITVTATLAADAPPEITNTATVSGGQRQHPWQQHGQRPYDRHRRTGPFTYQGRGYLILLSRADRCALYAHRAQHRHQRRLGHGAGSGGASARHDRHRPVRRRLDVRRTHTHLHAHRAHRRQHRIHY